MQKKHVIKKLEEKINENIKTDNSSKGTVDTSETPYKKILENCPNLKGKETASSALISPENNPIDKNMEPVNEDWIKEMPSDIKKLEEFMGPPHSNISDSVEEAKNTCTDELLDDMRHKSREFNFKIKQFKENNAKDIYFKKINKDDILNEVTNEVLEDNSYYEEVNHPDHYNVYDVEVVEMMERIFGIEETMSWCKLNAFKYRMRAGEKLTSTVEKDLKKEKWCLNKYRELKSKI